MRTPFHLFHVTHRLTNVAGPTSNIQPLHHSQPDGADPAWKKMSSTGQSVFYGPPSKDGRYERHPKAEGQRQTCTAGRRGHLARLPAAGAEPELTARAGPPAPGRRRLAGAEEQGLGAAGRGLLRPELGNRAAPHPVALPGPLSLDGKQQARWGVRDGWWESRSF